MPRRYTTAAHAARNLDAPPLTAAPLTIACWYRMQATGIHACLISVGDKDAVSNDHKFRLARNSSSQLQFSVATGSSTILTGDTVQQGVWHHCLGSANATYAPNRVVLDGAATTLTSTNRIPTGVDSIIVGAQLSSGTSYSASAQGDIFWPAVWNAQLSAEEEIALAAGVSPREIRPQNLVFFVERDDQQRILEDAIGGLHLSLPTTADSAQYVPDIPPQVAARLPRRTARIYAFPAAGGTQSGAGSSAGSSTANAVGASTAAAAGTSAGVATAPGVGASTAEATGTSAGTSTADAVGDVAGGVQSGAGTSAGTSTASAVGASTAEAAGAAAGVSIAAALGADASAPEIAPATGGHYFPRVKLNDWRARSAKQRREYLERLLEAAESAPEDVREAVEEIIEPYQKSDTETLAGNVQRLDVARINRLIARIERVIEEEDDTLFLLLAS